MNIRQSFNDYIYMNVSELLYMNKYFSNISLFSFNIEYTGLTSDCCSRMI